MIRNRLAAEVAHPLIAFKDFVCDYKVGGYTPPLGPYLGNPGALESRLPQVAMRVAALSVRPLP
jgi:hypothetical protein